MDTSVRMSMYTRQASDTHSTPYRLGGVVEGLSAAADRGKKSAGSCLLFSKTPAVLDSHGHGHGQAHAGGQCTHDDQTVVDRVQIKDVPRNPMPELYRVETRKSINLIVD